MSNYGTSDPKEFGWALRAEFTSEEKQIWRSEQSTTTWANESLGIALAPAVGYCVHIGKHSQHDSASAAQQFSGK